MMCKMLLIGLPMKVMRRNGDAIKYEAGNQKALAHKRLPNHCFAKATYLQSFLCKVKRNNFMIGNTRHF